MRFINIFGRNKPEFYLENVIEKNIKFPRTFLIPNQEEIEKLALGNLVKLIFVMKNPQKNGCRAEKIWIKITNNQNGIFTGVLYNDPYYLKSIKFGDIITFKAENITAIYGGAAPFNEKLFAIITQKALNKRQINWVVRTDDLDNEQDSGWQLFYGDESDQYLENSKNAKIISLEQVLDFEPLLESVFSNYGYAYEYSERNNKFIEVKE
ncbi:immunity protein Imm33 domain-containing protein [Clostridium tarantellae]|uniref:DUF2185 domain-containing protein n=1 Tax=Clostridium tarantellae TaxID=39493 RepID=A0A6I1MQH1_9CLOT|nr:DUF2185 domain-containing protein [Clostridium tarantellae]MPQ45053.1 DUF2185 domain-containing protein [Clostridium tarantellae]